MNCPQCGSADVETIGRAEADEAILGEDEYAERCRACRAEWVRDITRTRHQILADER